ncbi:MAG: DUF4041 domain-containing protein [Mycobacteriales bacterium]
MGGSPRTLRPGEALPLEALGLTAGEEMAIGLGGAAGAPPDLVALLVGPSGRVRSDDDLVFYNNPTSTDGAVSYVGPNAGMEWVRLCPSRLDADVARVVLGCAGGLLDGSATAEFTLSVVGGTGRPIASATFPCESGYRAMILLEVYRRGEQWRCRLLAQGYAGGLAALVTEYGVAVEETHEPETPPPAVVATPPAAAPLPYPPPPAPAPQWTPNGPSRRGGLFTSRRRAQLEAENAELKRLLAMTGAMDNAAIATERDRLLREVADLAAEAERRRADLTGLEQRLAQLRATVAEAEGDVELAEAGIYRYRHRLDDAIAYKAAIDRLRDRIRTVAKADRAVTGNTNWTVNGSIAQGRKMVKEFSKLMLRAYNAEADHAVRTMRPHKLDSALARLDTTRATIVRLGGTMDIRISEEYHRQRRDELELTADYLSKAEEEKERQRELRERQREEQRFLAEAQREQERLERERIRYAEALAKLEERGDTAKAEELRGRLGKVEDALAGIERRRANARLGHVYVISNVGAFGERMVKIGMTRRFEPMDRVRELGDASVPFRFDVHALIFSEDAVALETALHQRFAAQRVNRVNAHREFFYISPAEVRDALAELGRQYLLHFTETMEAPEWRQSGGPERALLPT